MQKPKAKEQSAKKQRAKGTDARALAHTLQEQARQAHSDVLGSYTGTPADGGQPVQDADDL